MDEMKKIANGIIEGEKDVVVETVTQLLKEEISPLDILDQALIPGIEKVGELYQEGEYFIVIQQIKHCLFRHIKIGLL